MATDKRNQGRSASPKDERRCPGCGSILVPTKSGYCCYEAAMGRCKRGRVFSAPKASAKEQERLRRDRRQSVKPLPNQLWLFP